MRKTAVRLLLPLALAAALTPPAMAASSAPIVSVSVTGLDGVVAGEPAAVDVVVKVTGRGNVRDDTPLRVVGTLTMGDAPSVDTTVGLVRGDGSTDTLDVDAAGRFVFPREDRAPLTLAATPALESAGGHTARLRLSVPDEAEYELDVALVVSNERSASVVRRSGADRLATAAEISARTFNAGVDVAYVARADDFPDALAGGPVAGIHGRPILLSHSSSLPAPTAAELARLRPGRIAVLGGKSAVSDAVLVQLEALTDGTVTRLAGPDRFATAAAIAIDRFPAPIDTVFVATGANFADALAGGPAAAAAEAPILLVRGESIPDATAAALKALKPQRIVVLGGNAAVSDAVVGRLGDFARLGVTRWFGATRFETAAAISARSFDPAATHTVYLATGANFPDALAGVPAAALDRAPLLLVTARGIPAAVSAEISRLEPGVVVILGGSAVVGESVADAATLLTRDIPPDRGRFRALASTAGAFTAGPVLMIAEPSTDAPVARRPRDRFTVSFATPHAGAYSLAYRPHGTGGWTSFPNPTAKGVTSGGMQQVPVNAPLEQGTFDLRLTFTPTAGSPSVVTAPQALQVALTFPPPLISSLVEGVEGQAQLVAVRPVGGLDTGTVLEIRLGSAERAGADYPLDPSKLTLLNGNGVAELIVGRDQEAMIRYTAGPGDRVPDGPPTSHPLLTFRIDGIDVDDTHEAHVGQFFRYDIMHGVQRIFAVGDGEGVASPTLTDLQRGSPHTFQLVSFAVGTPIEPFGTVTIDLSEAEQAGVDYSEAFAFVEGGGHEAGPEHEPPPGLGEAFLDVEPGEHAVLTFMAGPDGVPSVQPEGPTVQIFVGGIAVPDAALTPQVTFTRDDTGATAATRFRVRRMGLRDATASSLARDAAAQQTIAVTLDGDLSAGQTLYFDLTRAQRGGVDYSGADVAVLSGSGSATWDDEGAEEDPDAARVAYTAGFGDVDGTVVSLRFDGVVTPDADSSQIVSFYRTDSWVQATAIYDVGGGSPIVGPFASDLGSGSDEEYQVLAFVVREPLAHGETVTVDLSLAEAGAVSYGAAVAAAFAGEEWETPADVALDVVDGTSALVTFTAGEDGLAAGREVTITLDGAATEDVEDTYSAEFARSGSAQTATALFAVRRLPGVTAVSASSLASGANNQTQTFAATLVSDLPEGEILEIDLSGAEAGAGRYGGAAVTVVQGSGTAQVQAYSGSYATVVYRAGPGDTDGSIVEVSLSGVNTDAGDETHAADFVRYDSWRPTTALFDIGSGGPWVGLPQATWVGAASPLEWQGFSFRLVRGLAGGEQVTVDLTSAEAGGVSYGDVGILWTSRGSATLDVVPGVSALLTYTAPAGGVPAGRSVFVEAEGLSTDDVEEEHTVTFTDVTTGETITTTFKVVRWDGHESFASTATDYQLRAMHGRDPLPGPEELLGRAG